MKFMAMVWPAFLARVKPVSAMANPACMNMTKNPQTSVQTTLIAIRFLPTTSATLAASGSDASIILISSALGAPAEAPAISAMPPVLPPDGSGLGASSAPAKATRLKQSTAVRTPMPKFRRCFFISHFSFFRLNGSHGRAAEKRRAGLVRSPAPIRAKSHPGRFRRYECERFARGGTQKSFHRQSCRCAPPAGWRPQSCRPEIRPPRY